VRQLPPAFARLRGSGHSRSHRLCGQAAGLRP
jgi:hypothetical protein